MLISWQLIVLPFLYFGNISTPLPAPIPTTPIITNASYYGLQPKLYTTAIAHYNKLVKQHKVQNSRYITICNMKLSSAKKRLFLIDMQQHKVVYALRVAHGQGSGGEYATQFGNEQDSHKTSLGIYTTGSTYTGQNGLSLKLYGLQKGVNDNAYNRAIVIHGSDYVTDKYYNSNRKIGRSWGCPAVSSNNIADLVNKIKNGSFVYITKTDG